ncbi:MULTISPECIES: GerAB/ArcD/ProY family transporter [Paenibacillus]|uniref:GerAB/ArcD/ProY family transporter n=1 Tax=Paenibacillus violae TaxID=3077234 RepID=A0ABU3RQB3_9BACL|nr:MULTISPECIES: GerAB/ArcD/ProY family transporter [Paenibacillus]MDU0206488.1 GerAB/ArcD/ProY family transporter [Paenibacillus sp. PFR10]MEC0267352.1 GerAB/ArcD/ProY family transporter [Paenibacillus anseongense]
MKASSLYERTATFGGIYVFFMANRSQMLYFVLVTPSKLVYPYMLWALIAVGILSQLNMILIAKWFSSDISTKGYQGFVQLFGKRTVRVLAFVGLFFIFAKIYVSTLGTVEVINSVIFPSMNPLWLILFLFGICLYAASRGMTNTIRFVVIAFFGSAWMILCFIPFFFPSMASLHDLYPLIPTDWSTVSWKNLLFIWQAFSGPEYLVFIGPWLNQKQKMLKYLTFANTASVFEYLIMFVVSLLFFSSQYLSKSRFPVTDLIRYLQTPVFERIDIILICLQMFYYVWAISIYFLWFYGAIRIVSGRLNEQSDRIGFITCWIMILISTIILDKWLGETEQNPLINLQIWLRAFTYLFIPTFLLIACKRKGLI